MYKRRKIEKEVKSLLKKNPIKYEEILEIHGRYGIWFARTLHGKNKLSYETIIILFKRKNRMTAWELSLGFYPGFVIGMRSYDNPTTWEHVLYVPFVELCLTVFKDASEE